jgi:hypothetical protein
MRRKALGKEVEAENNSKNKQFYLMYNFLSCFNTERNCFVHFISPKTVGSINVINFAKI